MIKCPTTEDLLPASIAVYNVKNQLFFSKGLGGGDGVLVIWSKPFSQQCFVSNKILAANKVVTKRVREQDCFHITSRPVHLFSWPCFSLYSFLRYFVALLWDEFHETLQIVSFKIAQAVHWQIGCKCRNNRCEKNSSSFLRNFVLE